MGTARGADGAIYETDANGDAIRIITPAPTAGPGHIFTLSQSPKDARAEAHQNLVDDRAEAAAKRADHASERADATALRVAAAAEATAKTGSKPTEFQAKSAGFLGRMMQAEHDFGTVPEGERGARSLPRQAIHQMAPGIENTLLNSADRQKADQAVENFIAASLRQESGAAISPQEFTRQYGIFFPAPGDGADLLKQKSEARRQTIEGFKIAAGPLAEQAAGTVSKPVAETNSDVPAEVATPQTAASGQYRFTDEPRVNSTLNALMTNGASESMVNAVLTKNKLPRIRSDQYKEAMGWVQANPGMKYTGSNIQRATPLTLMQKIAGSAPGAFAATMANSAAAGIPAAMAGPSGQGAIDAMSALHPDAAVTGNVVGGITGAGGMEMAAARAAPAALARFAPRIADALYGGISGFNSAQEGEGGMGALTGAAGTALGGAIGSKIVGGLGKVATGVRDPALQLLRNAGVPMTVGQVAGKSGWLGKTVRGLENRMSGYSGVGDSVNARYVDGFEGLANRMNNDAVAPINGTANGYGQGMVDNLKSQASDAYVSSTAGAHVPLDPQFGADMAGVRGQSAALPDDLAARFDRAINNRVAPVENAGMLTGDSFQQSVRGLKGYRAEMPKAGFEQDYRDALSGGIDALRSQMIRGGGQDVVSGLANADQAYRQVKIIEKATKAARNGSRSGEVGLPTPSQFNDAAYASAEKYGTPRFNGELLDAAQSVLPNKVPDSGSAGRLGLGALLAGGAGLGGGIGMVSNGQQGAASGGALGLGAVLMLAAGGSKPAQTLATKMLLDRPQSLIRFGTGLERYANFGGAIGAGAASPLTIGH